MKFGDLKFKNREMESTQARMFFSNGYGASIVRGHFTYGGPQQGLYELAVLQGNEASSAITYLTPITNDVLGHLSESRVEEVLAQIEAIAAPIIEEEA